MDRDTQRRAQSLGRELAALRRDVDALKRVNRSPQLTRSSIDDGALEVRDTDGLQRLQFGRQNDGTFAVTYANGHQPPAPTDPVVAAHQLALVVYWNGLFVGSVDRPGDFQRVDVHVSETPGFTPDGTTVVGSLLGEGAISVVGDNDPHYVRLVAVTHADVASDPSGEVEVTPLPADQIAAGAIDGFTITGAEIYGGLIFTAEDGQRIGLNGPNSALEVYDPDNNLVSRLIVAQAGITVDDTTVPRASQEQDGAPGSATTASFTPPADAVLVACVDVNTPAAAADVNVTVSGGGLTWTEQVHADPADAENTDDVFGVASIWTAAVASSSAMTVTASNDSDQAITVKVYIAAGADTQAPVGATSKGWALTNNITPTVYASTVAGSRGFGCGTDWQRLGVPSSTDVGDGFSSPNPGGMSAISAYKDANLDSVGTDVTMNFDAAGASTAEWSWAAVEIRPGAGRYFSSLGAPPDATDGNRSGALQVATGFVTASYANQANPNTTNRAQVAAAKDQAYATHWVTDSSSQARNEVKADADGAITGAINAANSYLAYAFANQAGQAELFAATQAFITSGGDILASPDPNFIIDGVFAKGIGLIARANVNDLGATPGVNFNLPAGTISGSYRHLLIVLRGDKQNDAQNFRSVYLVFNGDTTNNYQFFGEREVDAGNLTTPSFSYFKADASDGLEVCSFGNNASCATIWVFDYQNNAASGGGGISAKGHAWSSAGSGNGSTAISQGGGRWFNTTDPVTQIGIGLRVGDFSTRTSIDIYGVSNDPAGTF